MRKKFNFKEFFSKIKIEYLIVFGLGCLALFIFISSIKPNETENISINSYVQNLESGLQKSLSKVNGAGKTEVKISVKSGMQTVLATKTENIDGKPVVSPIIVGGKPVVLKEDYPEIIGVIIVCEGANNLSVKMSLINAVCVYLNVTQDKVEILKMR